MKRTFINKVILKSCCSGSQPCKKRDHQTLRAARLLRMTDEMSSRSVSTPVIPQCLYAGYRSFLLRPIPRIQTLRNDEAAGVRGFTLVELLVVVLIIGILSAVAIPMYQGAVDKSHWSTMLPASKAIKDAEEAFKMTNGEYSDTMELLDVTMNNSDLTFNLDTHNNGIDTDVVRVTSSKLGDHVRLASYLDASPKFGGQLHCEAKDNDERATRLCEKLLGGQYIMPVDGGYTAYLLDQEIDKDTCDHAEQSWSTSKTKCYRTDEARCTALDMKVVSAGQCGFRDESGKTIGEEGVCIGNNNNGCRNSVIENGGVCISNVGLVLGSTSCTGSIIQNGGKCKGDCGGLKTIEEGGICVWKSAQYNTGTCGYVQDGVQGAVICQGSGTCGISNTYDGGICVGTQSQNCIKSTFKNGAICYAIGNGACNQIYEDSRNTYLDTSCCCGQYCPDYAPKCAASRCDPYYMDPNNFKDL